MHREGRGVRRVGAAMVTAGALVGFATLALGPTPAGAVVGGTALADVADVNITAAAAPGAINVVGAGTSSVVAPAANGTTANAVGVALVGPPVAVTTTAASASATRGV